MRRQSLVGLVLLFAPLIGVAAYAASSTGTFQAVDSLKTVQQNPTASLLSDSTVLVAGGGNRAIRLGPTLNWITSQERTEVFDPRTNTFILEGSMIYPRANHAAVRLQDGRVLLVGGSGDVYDFDFYDLVALAGPHLTFFTATAEVYNSATGKFAATGDLITPRLNPTATLLPDGKVLVAGGRFQNTVETAELFDPTTGQFTLAGPMTLGRNQHAAVALPDGRVVLLGGYHREDGPQRSVEIYDPKTNTFSTAGQMAEARADFQANLLPDGRILVTGGISGPPDASGLGTAVLSRVEIYNPATGQSTMTDQMAGPRFNHGAVALADKRVLVVGGEAALDGSTPLSSAALIDAVTGKVSPAASMASPRGYAVPTLLPDGRVLVIGGQQTLPSAEVFVP